MGSACSKRSEPPQYTLETACPQSDSKHTALPLEIKATAVCRPANGCSTRVSVRTARSCALAICNQLELKLSQVVDDLDQRFAADSTAFAALQPGQLGTAVKEAAAASDLDTNSISSLLAVMYILSISSPAAATISLAKHSNVVNCLVSMLSAHCKPCSSASAEDCASSRWQEWQQICLTTGLTANQLPVLLTAASKAFLVQLDASQAAKQITVARVKVSRTAAFSDACSQLCSADAASLAAGPCKLLSTFIEASADFATSPAGMQQLAPQSKSHSSAKIASGIEPGTTKDSPDAITGGDTSTLNSSAEVSGFAAVAGKQPAVAGQESAMAGQKLAVAGQHLAVASKEAAVAGQQPAVASKESAVASSGEQEAGEGYGPRKEFFTLIAGGMTCASGQPEDALFVYNKAAACYWYNTKLQAGSAAQQLFYMAGWLAGQAVHNRTTLGIRLAPLLWQKVLEGSAFKATLQSLAAFDPEAAHSLQKVNDMSGQDLTALLELEGLPLTTTREAYVQQAVHRMCVEEVQWQSDSFAKGFSTAMSLQLLAKYLVTASDLAAMVYGSCSTWQDTKRLQDVFRLVLDPQLEQTYQELAACLWEVINGWTIQLKKQFLLFVTGSERLPAPHAELLRIELPFTAFDQQDHQKMLLRLPQAHTCDNIVELPNYQESLLAVHSQPGQPLSPQLRAVLKSIVNDRLKLAVTCCNSYGLDESPA